MAVNLREVSMIMGITKLVILTTANKYRKAFLSIGMRMEGASHINTTNKKDGMSSG
jgi:hypothetical protein